MNVFDHLVTLQLTWRDAVDVIVVAVIIYSILALVRGTRAMQVSIGLMILGSTFFIARAFELPALEAISREILFYLPFAVIVLFQAEIRRGLARMGGNPLASFFSRNHNDVPLESIVSACEVLAGKRIGALIAIEGAQTLRAYEEEAKPVDAIATADVLVSIFTPGSPLHDGAVIVRGSRIAAAGALLPLMAVHDPELAHGTRHRAALGLSEESDALIIVVSEENGSIAVAVEGKLTENLTRESLLDLMTMRLGNGR
jgi:diadenylate cyclase